MALEKVAKDCSMQFKFDNFGVKLEIISNVLFICI